MLTEYNYEVLRIYIYIYIYIFASPAGFILISFIGRTTLYCSSKNLVDAVENSTLFCSLSGKLLIYDY